MFSNFFYDFEYNSRENLGFQNNSSKCVGDSLCHQISELFIFYTEIRSCPFDLSIEIAIWNGTLDLGLKIRWADRVRWIAKSFQSLESDFRVWKVIPESRKWFQNLQSTDLVLEIKRFHDTEYFPWKPCLQNIYSQKSKVKVNYGIFLFWYF